LSFSCQLGRRDFFLDCVRRTLHNQIQPPDLHGGHDVDEAIEQSNTIPVDRESADAYAAFWQCIDADEPAQANVAIGPSGNAYEQFWSLVEADGFDGEMISEAIVPAKSGLDRGVEARCP
jgi:hypothetical protein